jgi:serine/threonine protein kinase
MTASDNTVRLIDFGIGKDLSALVGVTSTQTIAQPGDIGKLRGTLRYMAPELREGMISESSKDTDLWSVGIVAAELLFCCGELSRNSGAAASVLMQPNSADDIIPKLPLELLIADEGITEDEKRAAIDLVRNLLVAIMQQGEAGPANAAAAVAPSRLSRR